MQYGTNGHQVYVQINNNYSPGNYITCSITNLSVQYQSIALILLNYDRKVICLLNHYLLATLTIYPTNT